MRFSQHELIDLTKAWIAISVAFTVVLMVRGGGATFLGTSSVVIVAIATFILSAVTVGTGFLLHEAAHKYYAQKYGHFAEFVASDQMLLLALLMSPLGFIIALPGAVMISGMITRKQYGIISIAGPITNFVIAVGFLILFFTIPYPFVRDIATYGYFINTWLGLFNLIPVWEFDGKKILAWSKQYYFITLAVGLFLFFIVGRFLPF
tara:strand:- start:4497 stop:5114 length:618 start_codon:yes stop_codon:yes gene_type:complete